MHLCGLHEWTKSFDGDGFQWTHNREKYTELVVFFATFTLYNASAKIS